MDTDTRNVSGQTVQRHYPRAPIQEAIIEIRLNEGEPAAVERLDQLDGLKTLGYSDRRKLYRSELPGQTEVVQEPLSPNHSWFGYRYVGGEGRHILQLNRSGFVFSRLAPYQSWEQFRTEARRLWLIFRQITTARVIRIGIRYINQIELPLPIRDFRDFVRTYPEISSDLPQAIGSYFMQVNIPQIDIGAMLIVNQALLPPSADKTQPIETVQMILDLDVFRVNQNFFESDEEIWNTAEGLRVRKNAAFEACITNNTRRLFL